MDEREVADRLYALPPRRFVAERDAAVAAAREAGDATTAAALAKLRRPTVGAWLVNLLALRRPELVAELAELAAGLHVAQRELDGAQLRELGNQRRAMVSALVATARSVAEEVEPELAGGKLPLAEVETTLNAALSDREVAETVRTGRLTRAVSYEGFGEVPRGRLRLAPGGAGATPAGRGSTTAEPEPGGQEAPDPAAVAAELAEAREAAAAASAALDRAAAEQETAKQELARIDTELAELATRRTTAADRLAAAERASQDARRAVVAARRRLGEAEAEAEAG